MREDTRDKIPLPGSAKEKGKKEVGKSIKTKFQLALIAALAVFFFFALGNRLEALNNLEAQIKETDVRIGFQIEYAENLRRDEAYLQSEEFIRKIAYERLGLVGENDVVIERRRR